MAGKASKIEETALKLGEKIAEEQEVYIVDVEYAKNVLCYYIDREGGVGIDECEAFSRAVELALDEKDPIEGEYSLEVSSPGVDRKLKKEREFLYYTGREVEVKLYAARDGVKEYEGVLKGYHDKTAVIETAAGEIEQPIKDAVYIRLKFVF
ncbi:MAG: ribosome maturation factor RimP [Candidatus Ornithomonoglobus sp.]